MAHRLLIRLLPQRGLTPAFLKLPRISTSAVIGIFTSPNRLILRTRTPFRLLNIQPFRHSSPRRGAIFLSQIPYLRLSVRSLSTTTSQAPRAWIFPLVMVISFGLGATYIALKYYEGIAEQKIMRDAEAGDPAAQVKVGELSLQQNNVRQAFNWFAKSAEAGNVKAQHYMGRFFYTGVAELNIAPDHEQALMWFEKAAQQLDVNAMNDAGVIYREKGQLIKALECFVKAAERKHPVAVMNIGLMYEEGAPEAQIPKDAEKARKYYIDAVALGSIQAMYALGRLYETNEMYKDLEKAKLWYEKAANRGNKQATEKLKQMLMPSQSAVQSLTAQ